MSLILPKKIRSIKKQLFFIILLSANLALFLPNAHPLRVVGALLLITFLPGFGWASRLLPTAAPLLRWIIAATLSYILTMSATLLLHYLPGIVHKWYLLVVLNLFAILPVLITAKKDTSFVSIRSHLPLILIVLLSLLLRTANLNYSEFQGDEALVMIASAEALEGHEDALFLRSKGPGELLLPMALWRLTGTINESIARLPFTIASLMAIITVYLIGQAIGNERTGWLAALFFALNGFSVAFGRIVQYQALVLWMSMMAFLLAWQWRQNKQPRFAILSGLCLGAGLLAHFDAILVMPAILWLFVPPGLFRPTFAMLSNSLKTVMLFLAACLFVALPFYWPYYLNPQSNRTEDYIGQRIGTELRNNLPDFFHFNSFYSSYYYIILTTLLVFGLLLWLVWQADWGRWWLSALLATGLAAVIFYPTAADNLAVLPFAVLLLGAFFAYPLASAGQALVIWLAAPFLGYNFVVALGLTHIYTIVPTWSIFAALAWNRLQFKQSHKLSNIILTVFATLSTIFLWNSFIRHDLEYWQDYPAGNLSLYWTPYNQPPKAGFFGFAHRTGWKAIGQKIADGTLKGDYGSNEEPDVTTWYTRGSPRACDPRPEFYFLVDDLIDPVNIPDGIIKTDYDKIGVVTLPNQKHTRIMQQKPTDLQLGELDEIALPYAFDRTAIPAAFARSARGAVPIQTNFGGQILLTGYDIDTSRAWPGGRIPVTLYWQAIITPKASYQVFTHLENEAAGLIAQADGVPICWSYPTDLWQPGQIIADQHAISLSPDTIPGNYPLQVGLYLADTFERLDILDEAGNPAGTTLTLTIVEIGAKD